MENIEPIIVKRFFIADQAIKSLFKSTNRPNLKTLIEFQDKSREKYEQPSERELEVLINELERGRTLNEIESDKRLISAGNDEDRVKRYNRLSWEYGLISLNEIGAWPEMRGFDPRMTIGSILETASELERYISESSNYVLSDKRKKNIDKTLEVMESMNRYDIISSLPIILVPGSSIRGEGYHQWVKENHKDYHKHKTNLFGIDEGNVRALAHVMKKKEKIQAFIGSYKD